MRGAVASGNRQKIGKKKPPVKGAMVKQLLRLGWYGETVGNAAVTLRVKLHAFGQSLMVWHGFWGRHNGKSSNAKHCCDQTKGSKIFHG
jgi:hypothetical protein